MAQLEKFSPITDEHIRPESMYDQYDGVEHISEYEFHKLYEENPNASLVLQGFVTMVHRDLTGEPAIAYSMMYKITDAQKLKMFLYAFGIDIKYLKATDNIMELWEKCLSFFGGTVLPKKETVSVALPGGLEQVKEMQRQSRGQDGKFQPKESVEEEIADAIL